MDVTRHKSYNASIHDLPDELLVEIIAVLEYNEPHRGVYPRPSLRALSLTDRRFHRLAAESLYCHFNNDCFDAYLFLRALLLDPQLRPLVKSATLRNPRLYFEQKPYVPTPHDKKIIEEGLQSTGLSNWKQLATWCNDEQVNAMLICGVITMLTPNFSWIDVIHAADQEKEPDLPYPAWIMSCKPTARTSTISPSHGFQKLSNLEVDLGCWFLSDFAPIFHSSSLKYLEIRRRLLSRSHEEASTLRSLIPAGCNKIHRIDLNTCLVSLDTLEVLIASSSCLKEFSYHFLENMNKGPFGNKNIQPRKDTASTLRKMLEIHQNSLETLWLEWQENSEKEACIKLDLSGGLRDFTALNSLVCPLRMLVDRDQANTTALAEKIPPTLHTLGVTLSRHTEDVVLLPAMEHFANVCKDYTPLLKEVYITVEAVGPNLKYDRILTVAL